MNNLHIRPFTTNQTTIKINDSVKRILIDNFGTFPIIFNSQSIALLKTIGSENINEIDTFEKIIQLIDQLNMVEIWLI